MLIFGIRLDKEIGIRRILCYGDSDLVVQQSSGDWDAKDANMASYRFLVQQMSEHFDGCEFIHVPRADNDTTDALSRIGSTRQATPAGISLECLRKPSIKPSPESDPIFMPVDPGVVGSGLGTSAVGAGTSVVGAGTSVVGPGAAAPAHVLGAPAGGPGVAAVGPGTSSAPSGAAGPSPPPPSPAPLIPVVVS